MIFRNKISNDIIFATCRNDNSSGVLCINKSSQVLSIIINEGKLVPFIASSPQITDGQSLALKVAARTKLPGMEGMFAERFNQLIEAEDYVNAAKLAKQSSGTSIRNIDTINKLRNKPAAQG